MRISANDIEVMKLKIATLDVKPGDVIVAKVDRLLTENDAARLRDLLKRVFGGNKCVVLDNGVELTVASAASGSMPEGGTQ